MIKKSIRKHTMNVLDKVRLPFITYEPMLRHRYLMRIHDTNVGDQHFIISSCTRPTMNTNIVEIPYIMTSTWVAQPIIWEPIEIKILDVLPNSYENYFFEWMSSEVVNNKKNITIEKLDPTGVVVEKWELWGCFLQELNHEVVFDRTRGDIKMTIVYNRAQLIF